jgi:hypothetical protein
MNYQEMVRSQAKTPQQRFVQMLAQDFNFAPRIAQVILAEAQSYLHGSAGQLRPGQVRVILAKWNVSPARPLSQTETVEVTWTVDAGAEDREVQYQHGRQALRRVRIQRLLAEALAQNAVATQEDLAQVLNVSVRTIKRDFASLQEQEIYLPTRGYLQGIGRGQTHKGQIVTRWLQGATYDQIASETHHSLISVQRYVQTFVRVVELDQQGLAEAQIALVVQIGWPLVQEYLAIYHQNDSSACRQRLQEQLQRLTHGAQKGGL